MHAGVEYVGVIRGSLCRGVGVKGGGGYTCESSFFVVDQRHKIIL